VDKFVRYLCRGNSFEFFYVSDLSLVKRDLLKILLNVCKGRIKNNVFVLTVRGRVWRTLLMRLSGVPHYCGGAALVKYELLMTYPDSGSSEVVYHGKDSSCRIRGLHPGRAYRFQVHALNDAGVSLLLNLFGFLSLIRYVVYIYIVISPLKASSKNVGSNNNMQHTHWKNIYKTFLKSLLKTANLAGHKMYFKSRLWKKGRFHNFLKLLLPF